MSEKKNLLRATIDGWQSLWTGHGVEGKDKRLGATFNRTFSPQVDLEDVWREDDIAARIIEVIPREMTREGFETVVHESPEVAKAMDAALEDMGVLATGRKHFETDRGLGGSVCVLGADDGARDWAKPLDESRIKTFKWLRILSPDEVEPVAWQTNFNEPDFGEPILYRIKPLSLPRGVTVESLPLIHASRLHILKGIQITNRDRAIKKWMGESVLARCLQVIQDFQAGWAGAFTMMTDYGVPTFKLKQLGALLSQPDGKDLLQQRLAGMELARSTINAMVIDVDDSFERMATPLTGLSDLLDRAEHRLCLAADMPKSLLMGVAPAGMNGDAAGGNDQKTMFDRVKFYQTDKALPFFKRVMKLKFLSADGPTKGKLPESWGLEFCPLVQMSEKEWADVRKTQAETDAIYVTAMVLAPGEVRDSRFKGAKYSVETTLDDGAFSDFEKAEEQAEKDAQAHDLALKETAPKNAEAKPTPKNKE